MRNNKFVILNVSFGFINDTFRITNDTFTALNTEKHIYLLNIPIILHDIQFFFVTLHAICTLVCK